MNWDTILENSYDRWIKTVEAAPDRVLWGTDVSSEWHFDRDVYKTLVEFSQEFVEMLPKEYRDGYMSENAKRLFILNN